MTRLRPRHIVGLALLLATSTTGLAFAAGYLCGTFAGA